MKFSVIIPVFNEEQTIENIIERVLKSPYQCEVIVVDDGSTDRTRAILARQEKQHPGVLRCIFHETNLGKGAAIKTAMDRVTGDVIAIQDADLEYHPEDYPKALH